MSASGFTDSEDNLVRFVCRPRPVNHTAVGYHIRLKTLEVVVKVSKRMFSNCPGIGTQSIKLG